MEPVYYEFADRAGVWRRLLIDCVDACVIAFVWFVLTSMAMLFSPAAVVAVLISTTVLWVVCVLYLVFLKGSRFRTLGYVLAGMKIVDYRGERPTRWALFLRVVWAVIGPANFLYDLAWVPSDPGRQALRDKFAHTYVVRNDAIPVGEGRLTYSVYNAFGWTLMFAEVLPRA